MQQAGKSPPLLKERVYVEDYSPCIAVPYLGALSIS
ncbi:MAG: hypothetical protein RL693_696 [Verrucomicrobiota bacterium]